MVHLWRVTCKLSITKVTMTKQYLKHGMVYLTMLNSYEQDVEDLVLDIKARVAL